MDLFALGRWIGYLGVMMLTGAAAFHPIVRRHLAADYPDAASRLIARARIAAFLAAVLLTIAAVLKVYGQVLSLLEPDEHVSVDLLQVIVLETAWGDAWIAQCTVALVSLLLIGLIRKPVLIPFLALAALATGPLTGHAMENAWGWQAGVALHVLHQAGGGLWIGTLALVVFAGYGGTRDLVSENRHRLIARLVNAYSPVGLAGVGIATLAGLVLAWGYVGSIDAVWSTGYGKTLLVKTLLLAGTASLGAYNWRRIRPALGESVATERLHRSATWELVLGTLLLGATAVLVALPAPGME